MKSIIFCEVNKELHEFNVLDNIIQIKGEKKEYSIPFGKLLSIFIKDVSDKTATKFPFLLKIQGEEAIIVGFSKMVIRDFYKGYFTFLIKENSNIENHSEEPMQVYKIAGTGKSAMVSNTKDSFMTEQADIKNINETKSSFMEYLVTKPVLLNIFAEMNCTLTQFNNYFKQSFFYNIKNQKNVIDRLLNESLRNYKVVEDNFATRINNHSFLDIHHANSKGKEKAVSYEDFDFTPNFPSVTRTSKHKINDFTFEGEWECKYEDKFYVEGYENKINYDVDVLAELLLICKEAFNTSNEEGRRIIMQKYKKYEELLQDVNLKTFDPRKYLKNKYN